jgi:hypothetical protein
MKLLILGADILAADPVETENEFVSQDAVYPKNAIKGYSVQDVTAPEGFSVNIYVWNGTALVAKPEPVVPADVAAFITQVDADVDKLYDQAVGNRGPEYVDALNDALAFRATGYTTPVPQSVTDWSVISGLSLQAATDNVIAAAGALKAAQTAIRKQRLACKQAARVASTQAALTAAKAQWAGFLKAIRAQLGLA